MQEEKKENWNKKSGARDQKIKRKKWKVVVRTLKGLGFCLLKKFSSLTIERG
jgi:hypothetical protein